MNKLIPVPLYSIEAKKDENYVISYNTDKDGFIVHQTMKSRRKENPWHPESYSEVRTYVDTYILTQLFPYWIFDWRTETVWSKLRSDGKEEIPPEEYRQFNNDYLIEHWLRRSGFCFHDRLKVERRSGPLDFYRGWGETVTFYQCKNTSGYEYIRGVAYVIDKLGKLGSYWADLRNMQLCHMMFNADFKISKIN